MSARNGHGQFPFHVPLQSRATYVYALFCQDSDGPGYVKFGYSTNPGQRLTEILVGCPIPAKMYAVVEAGLWDRAIAVETALHRGFSDRRANGEWFRFDFSSADDKTAFNDGCRRVFHEHGVSEWWSKASVEELRRDARQRYLALRMGGRRADWKIRQDKLARIAADKLIPTQ